MTLDVRDAGAHSRYAPAKANPIAIHCVMENGIPKGRACSWKRVNSIRNRMIELITK